MFRFFGKSKKAKDATVTCEHEFQIAGTVLQDAPYPLEDIWERTVLYCPKCKTKRIETQENVLIILSCQKLDKEWQENRQQQEETLHD